MRKAPRDVTPVVHEGVRYEAPHWGHEVEPQPMRELPEVDNALMDRVHASVQGQMSRLVRGGIGNAMDPDGIAEVLRADGGFTDDDIHAVQGLWRALFTPPPGPRPQTGGHLVAHDDASGRELWRLLVYRTDYEPGLETDVQDVFITSLAIDGAHLIVRDERRRVHRVDLAQRAVIESYTDTTATPHDLAREAFRALPVERRKQLRRRVMKLKQSMDRHNVNEFAKRSPIGLTSAALLGGDASSLPDDLQRLLDDLGDLVHVHPLVATAREAGLRHQMAIAGGKDPHVLFDWYQNELSWIFSEVFKLG